MSSFNITLSSVAELSLSKGITLSSGNSQPFWTTTWVTSFVSGLRTKRLILPSSLPSEVSTLVPSFSSTFNIGISPFYNRSSISIFSCVPEELRALIRTHRQRKTIGWNSACCHCCGENLLAAFSRIEKKPDNGKLCFKGARSFGLARTEHTADILKSLNCN